MNNNLLLKWLLIIGGILELIIGSLLFILDPFLNLLGFSSIPIFTQMAGTFVFCYGILLIISSRNIEKYVIIPLMNILIRAIMVTFTFFNLKTYLLFLPITLFALIYDPVWLVLVLILMKKAGMILRK
ncbi:MAG: hypothetical protein ACFE85_13740 [Candidatus Hodarchaeota archaeon]